jgi:hypothetical protein
VNASPGNAPVLRPLGVGELLDRAVSLCVRNFGTFALIYLAFALPLAFFQFYGTADQSKVVGAVIDAFRNAGGKPPDPVAINRALGAAPANAFTYAFYFLALVVAPLPAAALISATARAYLGERVSFGAAYRAALGKWLPLIGIEVLYAVSGILAYTLVLVVAVLVVLALVLLGTAVRWLAVAVGIVVGIAFVLALVLGVTLVALAVQISFFACVVEGESFIAAFSTGLARVFGGGRIPRSLGVGLAYVAVSLGIVLVAATGQSILLGLLRNNVLGTVYGALLRVGTIAFTTAFVAIYYYDVRVRTEGLDLQLEAQRMGMLADPGTG